MEKKFGKLTLSLGKTLDKSIKKAEKLGGMIKKISFNTLDFTSLNNIEFEFAGLEASLKKGVENAAIIEGPVKETKNKKNQKEIQQFKFNKFPVNEALKFQSIAETLQENLGFEMPPQFLELKDNISGLTKDIPEAGGELMTIAGNFKKAGGAGKVFFKKMGSGFKGLGKSIKKNKNIENPLADNNTKGKKKEKSKPESSYEKFTGAGEKSLSILEKVKNAEPIGDKLSNMFKIDSSGKLGTFLGQFETYNKASAALGAGAQYLNTVQSSIIPAVDTAIFVVENGMSIAEGMKNNFDMVKGIIKSSGQNFKFFNKIIMATSSGMKTIGMANGLKTFGKTILNFGGKIIPFAVNGLRMLTTAFLTNPIGMIIAGVALAAGLIIAYWKPIGNFFKKLWTGIKTSVEPVINWIIGKFEYVTKIWGKIKGFFGWGKKEDESDSSDEDKKSDSAAEDEKKKSKGKKPGSSVKDEKKKSKDKKPGSSVKDEKKKSKGKKPGSSVKDEKKKSKDKKPGSSVKDEKKKSKGKKPGSSVKDEKKKSKGKKPGSSVKDEKKKSKDKEPGSSVKDEKKKSKGKKPDSAVKAQKKKNKNKNKKLGSAVKDQKKKNKNKKITKPGHVQGKKKIKLKGFRTSSEINKSKINPFGTLFQKIYQLNNGLLNPLPKDNKAQNVNENMPVTINVYSKEGQPAREIANTVVDILKSERRRRLYD